MLPRRAFIPATLTAACASPDARRVAPPVLSVEAVQVAAEAWHTDLCLPAATIRAGPLEPFARSTPAASAFAFGFGLESWMRAARPGVLEAFGALGGGPAVVSVRALPAPLPPGAEEAVTLRLPAGGQAAIARFIRAEVDGALPPAPADGGWLLVPAGRRYSLGFTCNTWVMAALAAGGLPVPVSGIRLRGEAMEALRAEAARQG